MYKIVEHVRFCFRQRFSINNVTYYFHSMLRNPFLVQRNKSLWSKNSVLRRCFQKQKYCPHSKTRCLFSLEPLTRVFKRRIIQHSVACVRLAPSGYVLINIIFLHFWHTFSRIVFRLFELELCWFLITGKCNASDCYSGKRIHISEFLHAYA